MVDLIIKMGRIQYLLQYVIELTICTTNQVTKVYYTNPVSAPSSRSVVVNGVSYNLNLDILQFSFVEI